MKAFRAALFDLGSNSIKFMLGEQKGATLTVFKEKAYVTRLAENMESTGRISRQAMKRSLDVVEKCYREAREFGASEIAAAGTSALRTAENRKDFLQQVKKKTGLSIRVISGKKEGELVFAGISSSKLWAKKPILAVDIGGGSMEFVAGQHGQISYARSLPLGCVRVRDHYLKSQPVKAAMIESATSLLRQKMAATLAHCGGDRTVVASGGTASALAWLQFPTDQRPALDSLEGFAITLKMLDRVLEELSPLSSRQIEKQFALPPGRADIIVAGATVMRSALLQANATQVRFASRGLRYGLWLESLAPRPFHHVQWQVPT